MHKLVIVITIVLMAIVFISLSRENMVQSPRGEKVLKIYNDFDLPLEPSNLTTMKEYNLALCIFRSLFELDEASIPTSQMLESWAYDPSSKAYVFSIRDVKWSDGKPFSANDIKLSILRLKKIAPQQFSNISSLLSHESVEKDLVVIDSKMLRLHIPQPNPELFMRLTSVFIPMIRGDLLDEESARIKNHSVSLGPYVVSQDQSSESLLVLLKNPNFHSPNMKGADRIEMKRPPSGGASIDDVVVNGRWSNIVLDQVFISSDQMRNLKTRGFDVWTRPSDRVMHIFPAGNMERTNELREITRWIGSSVLENEMPFKRFSDVYQAFALQPPGFVLHKKIDYPSIPRPSLAKKVYRVVYCNSQMPIALLKEYFSAVGLNLEFVLMDIKDVLSASLSGQYDLVLLSFGAADPSPVTWLSLVLENEFFFIGDYDHSYRKKLSQIKRIADREKQRDELINILYDAGREGLYVPLAHFSSVAISAPGISLKRIRESDETVDLSKVIFEE